MAQSEPIRESNEINIRSSELEDDNDLEREGSSSDIELDSNDSLYDAPVEVIKLAAIKKTSQETL